MNLKSLLRPALLTAAVLSAQLAVAGDLFMATNRAIRYKDDNGRVRQWRGLANTSPPRALTWMRDADLDVCRVYRLPGEFTMKRASQPSEYEFIGASGEVALMPVIWEAKKRAKGHQPILVVHFHGFRNDVNTAMEACAKMEKECAKNGVEPAFMLASWPTDTNSFGDFLKNYLADLQEAKASRIAFGQLIRELSPLCQANGVRLVVTGHSMGARLLDLSLKTIWRQDQKPYIDEAVLISGDITNSALESENAFRSFETGCGQVTCYFSTKDQALKLSRFSRNTGIVGDRKEDFDSRLGLTGPREPKKMIANAVAIDGTPAVHSQHSGWFDNKRWIADFAHVLLGESAEQIPGRQVEERPGFYALSN